MLNKRRYRRYFESDNFNKDYPAIDALQELQDIAEEYDKLNYKLIDWFERYDDVSNDLFTSIVSVLERKYGEVPLMFRQLHSLEDELLNEKCLQENFSEILDKLNTTLFKRHGM